MPDDLPSEALVAQRAAEIELLNQLVLASLESASVGAWWIDCDEEDTYHALDTTARMLGVAVTQDRSYRISEWMDVLRATGSNSTRFATIIETVIDNFAGTISGKYERYRVVYPIVLPDGTTRWVDARAEVSARDPSGRATRMSGTLIDVTRLMEVDSELLAHKSHLEALVAERTAELAERNRELKSTSERLVLATRAVNIGVWDWDIRNDAVVWDDRMYAIYGRRRGDFVPSNESWRLAIHPDDRRRAELETQAALRGERDFALELRVVWPDSSVRYLQCAALTFYDPDGKPNRMVGVNLDITERRLAQAERERLEAELRASQKMEAIGSLAGGVAHDFNNLLSVILNYTEFVMASFGDDDPRREDLGEVKAAAERAATLTRQLLAFGRKQVFQPVQLDLNQIAEGLEKLLRRTLGEDIQLVFSLDPDLGRVHADPGQLEQALVNLAVNAREAMPGGGTLTLATHNVHLEEAEAAGIAGFKPGPFVEVTVTDTGDGIDDATQARIFEPFFSTKAKARGTGLGLSTAFGIIKQTGGDIRVSSSPGRGCTFRILLPTTPVAPEPALRTPASEGAATGTETVLVVDDAAAIRNVARRVLKEAGYKVLVADGGAEALRVFKLHASEIDLVLTDVVMPEMSGPVLAKHLAALAPALKVVFMSGYTDDTIVHHGVLEHGVQFIAKPFSASDLTRKVREVLDGGELRARLKEALASARYFDILALVDRIGGVEPELASKLREAADNFDYDQMRDLLGASKD